MKHHIMGSLPVNRELWASDSRDSSMKYPNEVARGFVQRLYNDYPEQTGYKDAFQRIVDIADSDEFVENGRKELIDRGVDALYNQIKQVGDDDTSVKTDLLKVQSMDDDALKRAILARGERLEEFDPFGFELRTRAYNNRIRKHTRIVEDNAKALIDYNASEHSVDASRMAIYYETEMLYHAETSDKYRSFFAWRVERDSDVRDMYESVLESYETLKNREQLLETPLDDVLNKYGYESVDDARLHIDEFNARVLLDTRVSDAALLLTNTGRKVYEQHIEPVRKEYELANQLYAVEAYKKGQISAPMLVEVFRNKEQAPFPPQAMSDLYSKEYFERIKSHDLHDLDVDYYGQSRVGFNRHVVEQFADQYNMRLSAYVGARDYLEETNQDTVLLKPTEQDLYKMRDTVEQLYEGRFEIPKLEVEQEIRRKQLEKTITLDTDIEVLESLHNELSL